ncbi:hypothetical protein FRX31_011833, partial [Thalictrum thalictroides]
DALQAWGHLFPKDAMVSVLITEGRWNDYVQLLQFATLKNQILITKINSFLLADRVCWSVALGYGEIYSKV